MRASPAIERLRLKYVATINDEALSEETDPEYELQYVDIGNVDSSGTVDGITTYRFADAPSRARRRVRDGDVIISTVRTYLQAIAPIKDPPENLVVSTGFAVVRPRPGVFDAKFCKYALREPTFLAEVEKRSVGVSYPAINASDLADISICLPMLKHQKEVAEFLDREASRLNRLIAAKQRSLDLLAEKRRGLITRSVTRGLDSCVSLRDSGTPALGEIPKHWSVSRLKFLTTEPLAYGANEAALEDNPKFPRFVRITDVDSDGNLRDETFKSLPPEVAEPYLLKDGDILLARSGATVGKAFIYKPSWGVASFAGYMIRCRCNTDLIEPDFLFSYAQTAPYWWQIEQGTIRATIQNFSAEKYGDLVVPVPPRIEQKTIIAHLSAEIGKLDALRSATEQTIALLKERKAALIAVAVTGRLEVT